MGNPTVTPLVENRHDGGFMVSEANGHRSIDQGVLQSGQKYLAGMLLGLVTAALSASALAMGSNTGNGTFGTITPQAAPATIPGTYAVVFTAPTAFTVTAPDGATAAGAVGAAFSALGIGFTIAAGGTAFVAGDSFAVTATATPGNPTMTSVAGTNTGNGTLGSLTAAGYAAQLGLYTVEMDDATHFVVFAPNGQEVGHGTTGVAFKAGGIAFTLTAGGTAFVPGDSFSITVGPGSGFYRQWDPANVDGSQVAAGILYASKDATNVNKPCAVVSRACEVNQSELIFPTGANAAVIATGAAQLKAIGILCR